jgi:hypothetical protein
MQFGYQDLEVWSKAVEFAVDVIDTVELISTKRKHYRLLEQIEASSTSIPMEMHSERILPLGERDLARELQ